MRKHLFAVLFLSQVLFVAAAQAELCIPVLMDCETEESTPQNPTPPALPGATGMKKYSFKNEFGSRNYYLFTPSKYDGKKALPLMVMLHGCFQTAEDFARDTGMNTVAEEKGFAVLYPEQTYQDNPWKCWNWFEMENLERGSGELAIVAGMLSDLKGKMVLDTKHVYSAGLSAGGAFAANLATCYSDVFAGAGIQSGVEYMAATTEAEAHEILKSGPNRTVKETGLAAAKCAGNKAQPLAIVALHGAKDPFVNPVNATRIVESFTVMNDQLDDGTLNQSQTTKVLSEKEEQVAKGYKYITKTFGNSQQAHIKLVMIKDMQHGWSGSARYGAYADPRGPNASRAIWEFVSQFSR